MQQDNQGEELVLSLGFGSDLPPQTEVGLSPLVVLSCYVASGPHAFSPGWISV